MNRSIRIVMMKIISFLIFLSLSATSVVAEDVSPGGAQAVRTDADVDVQNPTGGMAELMDHPIVQEAVKACDNLKGNNTQADSNSNPYEPYGDLGDCIWGNLSAENRQQINEYLEQKEQERGTNAKFEGKGFGVGGVKVTDEMLKMQEIMAKKIKEGTYGTGEKKNIVAHGNYYTMAEQALGKNLVQAVSYYCMNTDTSLIFPPPNDSTIRPPNDSTIRPPMFVFDDETFPDDNDVDNLSFDKNIPYHQQFWKKEMEKDPKRVAQFYQMCMTHIQDICYDNVTDTFISMAKGKVDTSKYEQFRSSGSDHKFSFKFDDNDRTDKRHSGSNGNNYCKKLEQDDGSWTEEGHDKCKNKYVKSKTIACTIARQMKETRSAMDAIKKIKDRFKNLAENSSSAVLENDAQKYESRDENSINSLTTFSSDELVNADVEGILSAKMDRFKECFNEETGEVVGNNDKCQEFIDLNRSDKEKLIAEYVLRRRSLEVKMEEQFGTEQEVIDAAMEQGYTQEEAKDLYQIEGGKFLKEQLQKRFAAESDAIHQQLLDKMNARTVAKDGEVTKTGDNATLEKIGKELAGNVGRMKQLIRFNNIMSGFFQVGEGTDAKSNLVPLNVELATIDDNDPLKRSLKDAMPSLTDGSDEGEDGVVGFGAGEVRKILDVKRREPSSP